MFKFRRSLAHALLLPAVLLIALPALGRPRADSSRVTVKTVVTALGPDYSAPPKITKEDVSVYSGKNKLDVTGWVPATGSHGRLDLAILIDEAVSPSAIGLQFNDLKTFIEQQPSGTQVGIFYAQYGTITAAANFSSDHTEVAKKLRLPFGRRSGASPSIYLSLSSLIKKWPGNAPRREVLVLASGMDLLQPGVQDPYFDQSLTNAQRAGVNVYSIYVGGMRLGLSFFGMIAQGNLGRITSQTGGDAFFQGVSSPVSFKPFLENLDTILRNQYLLAFEMPASSKKNGQLRGINVRVEQNNVKLLYPHQVLVPGE